MKKAGRVALIVVWLALFGPALMGFIDIYALLLVGHPVVTSWNEDRAMGAIGMACLAMLMGPLILL